VVAGKIPAGARYDEMMSHIDCWSTLASMAGIIPPPHGADWLVRQIHCRLSEYAALPRRNAK
jgi:arylsulfatase A-like enzyme